MNGTRTISRPRPRRARRVLRALGLLSVLAIVLAAALWHGVQELDVSRVHLVIDGEEIVVPNLLGLDPGTQLLAVLLIAAVLLGVMFFVPLVLLCVAVVVLPLVLMAVGIPLALLLGIGALLLTPVVLLGLLVWWLLRTLRRENKPRPSATMPR